MHGDGGRRNPKALALESTSVMKGRGWAENRKIKYQHSRKSDVNFMYIKFICKAA